MKMGYDATKKALSHAKGMVKQWQEEAERLEEKVLEMRTCKHVWENNELLLAEANGRDLSYYDSRCQLCDAWYSDTF